MTSAGAAGVLALGALAPFAAATPAAASPAECERGANGFVDIPDTLSGTPVYGFNLYGQLPGGVRVELQRGVVRGVNSGWAKIFGGSTNPGDTVWMDWTWDGGRNWIQCGPFAVGAVGQSKTSASKRTSPDPNYQFRACGRLAQAGWWQCGPWW